MPPRCPRGRTSRRFWRSGRRHLEGDLEQEQHEQPRDVEAVGQERAVARVRALLVVEPADGQDRLVGLAGQQVPAARAAVDQQPDAGGVAALDLGAVGRRSSRSSSSRSPSRPTGTPGCSRWSRAGSRPGSRRSATTGRSPIRRGGSRRRAIQRAIVGRVAVAHRAAEHGQRQAVDLEVDDAGDVGAVRGAEPARDAPGHAQVVLVVVVGPRDDHLQHGGRPRR